jgi:TetR/AcrR family transcriptional repressor of nem operon
MQPGSLYAAFKNKETLFLLVLERYSQELFNAVQDIFRNTDTALGAVQKFIDSIYRQVGSESEWKGCLLVNSVVELGRSGDGNIQQKLRNIHAGLEQAFARRLNQARLDGELEADVDPAALSSYLITCLWGVNAISGTKPDEQKLRSITDIVVAGLPFKNTG